MTRTHKYICAALSLCFTLLCIGTYSIFGNLSVVKALIPVCFQVIFFLLLGEKSLVSCSLSLLPATALAKYLASNAAEGALPGGASVWIWVCLALSAAIYLLCRKPWPDARKTTANWVGAFSIIVTAAIVASVILTI